MPSFFITTSVSNVLSLADTQTGFVSSGTTLYGGLFPAINTFGTTSITAMGTIASDNFSATIIARPEATKTFSLMIGREGAVINTTSRAIVITQDAGSDAAGSVSITNHGLVQSVGAAIFADGAAGNRSFTLTNTGMITASQTPDTLDAAIAIGTYFTSVSITNYGLINTTGRSALSSTSQTVLTNHGTINGSVNLSPFSDQVVNAGNMEGFLGLGDGVDTFRALAGSHTRQVDGGLGDDLYILHTANIIITDSSGTDRVTSFVSFSLEGTSVENLTLAAATGTIGRGSYTANNITSQEGDDTLTGLGGNDTLFGNDGNDVLIGGNGNDYVLAGDGDDLVQGGTGNDLMSGEFGNDTVRGGAGNDTLSIGGEDDAFFGDSGIDLLNARANIISISVNLTTGLVEATGALGGSSKVSGVENVNGSLGNDVIIGNALDNRLQGDAGGDYLSGAAGADVFLGGTGADTLTGGAGADIFIYSTIGDSTLSASDLLVSFLKTEDKIDLSAIDAIPGTLVNDDFMFIGTAAFSAGGGREVRYVRDLTAGTTTVEVRLQDLDLVTDMVLTFNTPVVLTVDNFIF